MVPEIEIYIYIYSTIFQVSEVFPHIRLLVYEIDQSLGLTPFTKRPRIVTGSLSGSGIPKILLEVTGGSPVTPTLQK